MGRIFTSIFVVILMSGISLGFKIDAKSEDQRIIGGFEAKPGQFPYQISLRIAASSQHLCGGSIISDRWIITAAHCTQGRYSNVSNLFVMTGAHHIQNDGDKYELSQIINHPGYQGYEGNLENDIALLQTMEEIRFSDVVRMIPLRSKCVDGGVRAIVSGWGRSDDGKLAEHLKYVQVYTMDNDECRQRHHNDQTSFIHESTLCTILKEGHGACHGDSGGPLASGGKLIGVVSWGIPCARNRPDAFTRVTSYLDWIAEHTGVFAY